MHIQPVSLSRYTYIPYDGSTFILNMGTRSYIAIESYHITSIIASRGNLRPEPILILVAPLCKGAPQEAAPGTGGQEAPYGASWPPVPGAASSCPLATPRIYTARLPGEIWHLYSRILNYRLYTYERENRYKAIEGAASQWIVTKSLQTTEDEYCFHFLILKTDTK